MLIFFLTTLSLAATPSRSAKPEPTTLVATKKNPAAKNKVLWDAWYTVHINGSKQAYYSEYVEEQVSEKKISVSQHWWEREQDGSSSETLIASLFFQKEELTPSRFYVEKKKISGSYSAEAQVTGNTLTIKIKPSQKTITVPLSKGAILGMALPFLVAKHGAKNNRNSVDFQSHLEDPRDGNFRAQNGRFKLTGKSESIRKEVCYQLEMHFGQIPSTWWITTEGKLCRANIGLATISLTDNENTAKAFF